MNSAARISPSPRFFALIAALFVAAVLPSFAGGAAAAVYVAATAGLAMLALFDALTGVGGKDVTADGRMPPELFVGGDAEISVDVAVTGVRVPLDAEALLETSAALSSVAASAFVIPTEGVVRLAFEARALRRGPAGAANLWIRFFSPFGLWRRTVVRPLGALPDVGQDVRPVRDAARRADLRAGLNQGLRIRLTPGEGSDFDALREFAAGHDRRAMHWKASARHRKLLVRDFRAESARNVVVAFDAGRLMSEPLGGVERADHAVRAALLLGFEAVRAGDRLGAYAFAGEPGAFLAPEAGQAAFRAFRSFAAALVTTSVETNFTAGLASLAARLKRRTLIVVCTEFADATTAELMTDHLGLLAKKHLVLFLALRDPELERIADRSPLHVKDAAAAAVAYDLVRDRAAVLAKLKRLGVDVLDVAAGQATAALVERYLHLKRRERL